LQKNQSGLHFNYFVEIVSTESTNYFTSNFNYSERIYHETSSSSYLV